MGSPLGVWGWDAERLGQLVVRQERSRFLKVASCCFWLAPGGEGRRWPLRKFAGPLLPFLRLPTGPWVALSKLHCTRRLNEFLLMMLQSHHQSHGFGKYWVNKATGMSLLQDFTEPLRARVTLQDGTKVCGVSQTYEICPT